MKSMELTKAMRTAASVRLFRFALDRAGLA